MTYWNFYLPFSLAEITASVWNVSLVGYSRSTSLASMLRISQALNMSLSTHESACNDGFGPSGFSILAATSNTTSKELENVLKTPRIKIIYVGIVTN